MSKYKTFMIICFFILIFSLSKVEGLVVDNNLLGKIIYLDAGHGGIDEGASNKYIIEKDMNLVLIKKLESELISKGAIVYLTRDGDYDLATNKNNRKRSDLYNRAKLINSSDADIYISIHLNSTTSSVWRGLQIFYNSKLEENKIIADIMNDTLKEKIKNVREVKKVNDYYMHRLINKPGILIEAGFISNANDNYLLRQSSYQDKLVKQIVKGIENYFNYNKNVI